MIQLTFLQGLIEESQMFKVNSKIKLNKPIHDLLNNGYVFALINSDKTIPDKSRYHYQLTTKQKHYKGSAIVEIKTLLIEV